MSEPLKNHLNKKALKEIADILLLCDNTLDVERFVKECSKDIEKFELKDRVKHIILHLHNIFPNDFNKTAEILEKLPKFWSYNQTNSGWFDYKAWALIDYVGIYGLNNVKISLKLLKNLTHLFSAEFAIRPFLQEHFEETIKEMKKWCNDEDVHARRLVSEGTRLRLPWAKQVPILFDNIDITLPIILNLVDDTQLYVRKSVANHLNDISKNNPELVISTCKKILDNPTKNREWLVKRAMRTINKKNL